ncbi:neogenin-like [Ruditapes philippinarum]|uniref:neogenin-like n=1 Tax=Ruditapes philippinarum TaxID=129788 RepID=UPI00295BD4B0|nr:neogenin-like [Ruditapes philippinarum]
MTGVVLYSNGSLHISSATLDDTGEYTCLARNIAGMVEASTSVSVHVAPELTLLPLSQGVKVGSKVFLHCQANGVPDPTYSWSKDGEGMIISSSDRQIYLNNTLVIHSVTKQDEGVYRCIAGNDLGVTQAVAAITVTVPPSFTTVPSNQTVQVGSSVQLRCVAVGDPVPTQRWTKDDRQLTLDGNMVVSLDQSTVTITEIKAMQYGKYTCTATNIAGTESVSAWLNIYDIPEFSVVPSDTVVRQSATLSLLCRGEALEMPSVMWYKGREGELSQLRNDERVTVTDSGLLQIKSVDESTDEGWYTCLVKNTAGAISREVFVDVQVPPKILSTNSPQSATLQSQVTLTCQSIGDPAPSLQWISPSGTVINTGPAYKMLGNILMITSMSGEDVGSWTCKYCNTLGCDSALIEIIVEGMPRIKSFTGSQDGSLITLECTVEGNPEPDVTFSNQGQTVTSALQGHTVKHNRMLIEIEFLKTEYKCVAGNVHGQLFRIIQVPSKMNVPVISQTSSGPVTLSWKVPDNLGNLPLTSYSIQKKSENDVTWQPVQVEGHDLLSQRSLEVTGLEANRGYTFRVAASNLLGLGEYSDQSSSVVIKSTAPSAPENVLVLEIGPEEFVAVWKRSKILNAPIADVVYEYKIFRQKTGDGVVTEVIHRVGTVLHNETLQIKIDDLTEAAVYKLSIWARNIQLNISSDTVTVTLDNTQATYLDPGAHSGIDTFGRDKLIAIVAGCVGGIILVIIIVCIVTRVRAQRKTKTLSLLNHTLSLDQFYMENPKTLYTDDKYSSKRKSGHSFYSFDESFQSTMGSKGKRAGSVEYLGSDLCSDVLLVSKSPLYPEHERQIPLSHTSSRDQLYNENTEDTVCVQSEIQLPDCDISLVKAVSRLDDGNSHSGSEAETSPTTVNRQTVSKEIEADTNSLYSAMNGTNSDKGPDQSSEHIYTSIHSGDLHASTSKQHIKRADKSGSQKRPLIVLSPEKNDDSTKSESTVAVKDTNIDKFCDKLANSKITKKERETRSASPEVQSKGNDSYQPKPPIRVLSLDLLKPSAKMDNQKGNNLKILSENMLKENNTINKNIGKNSVVNRKDTTDRVKPDDQNDTLSNVLNGRVCNSHKNGHTCESDVKTKAQIELDHVSKIQKGTNGDKCHLDTLKGDNQCRDNFIVKPKPKNVLDDNFLTDAEIKQEISSAELY